MNQSKVGLSRGVRFTSATSGSLANISPGPGRWIKQRGMVSPPTVEKRLKEFKLRTAFSFMALFDFLVAYPLTLLLTGRPLLGFSLDCLLAFFRHKDFAPPLTRLAYKMNKFPRPIRM